MKELRDKIEIVKPADIEKRSFEIIGKELEEKGIVLPEDEKHITMRAIHTTAEFDYAKTLTFSENAANILTSLIENGADVVTDTNMALSGINKKILSSYGGDAHCFMGDEDVAKEAKERGTTKATVCMERAAGLKKPVIIAVGNAPTALVTLYDMILAGKIKPAFIIGVPVGFVNVEVSKELIMETDIPYIVNRGRKGGSNVAAAILNAVLYKLARG
ncbi:MAG: precorrin-8X methylmutase [Eubacterium sp.]|nr:precorrin-8X methylmutase [Eubacterium sp.]